MSNARKIKPVTGARQSTNVVDLDALTAEATGEPFAFMFEGKRYEIPNHAQWTLEDMQVLHEHGLMGVFERFLAEDAAAHLRTSMRVGQLRALDAALGAHITGAGTGE